MSNIWSSTEGAEETHPHPTLPSIFYLTNCILLSILLLLFNEAFSRRGFKQNFIITSTIAPLYSKLPSRFCLIFLVSGASVQFMAFNFHLQLMFLVYSPFPLFPPFVLARFANFSFIDYDLLAILSQITFRGHCINLFNPEYTGHMLTSAAVLQPHFAPAIPVIGVSNQ